VGSGIDVAVGKGMLVAVGAKVGVGTNTVGVATTTLVAVAVVWATDVLEVLLLNISSRPILTPIISTSTIPRITNTALRPNFKTSKLL
jgi:hypothetical protein